MFGSPAACSGDMYAWRAERRAELRQRAVFLDGARRADGLGDTEVRDDGGTARQQDVIGLDVPVNDAALVRIRERARHVPHDAHDGVERQRSFFGELCAKGFPLDERHRVIRQPVRVARRNDGDDVRLLERGNELDFALEPFDVDARGQFGREQLDDDLPVESLFVGDEHLGHAAATEFALEDVR
jgi:hypothetical protein